MQVIKKILVPVDFSDYSMYALEMAADIARQTDAEITLLHVIDVPSSSGGRDSYDLTGALGATERSSNHEMFMMEIMKLVNQKIQALKEKYKDVSITEKVAFDRVARHIADFVISNDTNLIVMGSRGISAEEGLFVGSNTQKVIRLAKCPVLTVKQPVSDVSLRNICFASDFKETSPLLVSLLRHIQVLFGSTLHLVKVITPGNFEPSNATTESIRGFAEANDLENYTINYYNYYTEYEGIIEFSKERRADLIALGTYGNTGLVHLLMGSIAEDVANHSDIPVLTTNQYSGE